jgi:hypothetical protein
MVYHHSWAPDKPTYSTCQENTCLNETRRFMVMKMAVFWDVAPCRLRIPEDSYLLTRRRENLKSHSWSCLKIPAIKLNLSQFSSVNILKKYDSFNLIFIWFNAHLALYHSCVGLWSFLLWEMYEKYYIFNWLMFKKT